MTILQLVPHLEAGGVERGTLEVAAELVRRGHTSLVISGGGRLVPELTQAGSEHITLPIGAKSPATLRLVGKLRHIIRDRRVDIVHARSRVPAWIGYWACRNTPARFVTTVHGLYSVNAYSAIMTKGERVIAVSETVRRYILENYRGCEPRRVCLVPNGVDPEQFPRDYRPPAEPVLTLPGRLTRLKGHPDFFELLRRLPHVAAWVVGDEDPRRRAYATWLRRVAPPNVTFLGHQTDMRRIYQTSSIVFSLSRQPESFGRTTLEALSVGVPVIGYDHGGVGEILAALHPAGRVPVGDVDTLVSRTEQLLQHAPPVPLPEGYRLADTLANTIRVYEELLAAPR